MKKNRILALILALVMLISLVPMNALAMTVTIIGSVYEDNDAKLDDTPLVWGEIETKDVDKKTTIKTKDYDDLIMDTETGELYEIIGLHVLNNKVMEKLSKTDAANNIGSATVSAAPVPEDYKTDAAYEEAYAKWAESNSEYVLVTYGPHIHKLSRWNTNNTNHWRNCLQCKEEFLLYDWHHDADKDGTCDQCKSAIVYYSISVPEVEGVKAVTLEGPKEDSTAAYNDKITVTVEAEEGYKITDVRVYKVRADGSKDQIVRDIVEFYKIYDFVQQNFDTEIVIKCEKQ